MVWVEVRKPISLRLTRPKLDHERADWEPEASMAQLLLDVSVSCWGSLTYGVGTYVDTHTSFVGAWQLLKARDPETGFRTVPRWNWS